MRKIPLTLAILLSGFATLACAGTVILRDGGNYAGKYQGGAIHFTDSQGVKYQFPLKDVQSLAFHDSTETVTLRDGKSYNGHFAGSDPVSFQDAQSVKYQSALHTPSSLAPRQRLLRRSPPRGS